MSKLLFGIHQAKARLNIIAYLTNLFEKGGPGSGNWAHTSTTRRGTVGGSDPGGGHAAKGLFGAGVGAFLRAATAQKVVSSEHLGGGVNKASLVTYERDGQGVWKKMEGVMGSGQNEVMAFELDRLLGLGVVPPTVVSGAGTSQLFVDGAKTGVEHISGRNDIGWNDFLDKYRNQEKEFFLNSTDAAKVAVLDILTGNADRHSFNYLVKEGRVVAIDNGILGSRVGAVASRSGPASDWAGENIPTEVTKNWNRVTRDAYERTIRKGNSSDWKQDNVSKSWEAFVEMRDSGKFPPHRGEKW